MEAGRCCGLPPVSDATLSYEQTAGLYRLRCRTLGAPDARECANFAADIILLFDRKRVWDRCEGLMHKRPSGGPIRRVAEGPQRVCAVERRRFPVGANPTRQIAPAGSNRSSHGGNEMAEAFGMRVTNCDRASVQAATRVNAEQAPKRTMCRPTRRPFRGRLIRLGEDERRRRPVAASG